MRFPLLFVIFQDVQGKLATKPGKSHRLLAEERRRGILELLDKDGRVTVEDVVDQFSVSAVTARSDLDLLAEAGALVRSHGGAVRQTDGGVDYPIAIKQTQHDAEKARIAEAAVALIKPEQTIILDSGTTTAAIARQIRMRKLRLTVITNALNVAMELCRAPQVSVIMLGGIVRPTSYSMVGPQAEQTLHGLRADHLMLGVDAMDPDIGVCTPDILEAQLNALMMKVSREVTAVADSSKFHRRGLSVISKMEGLTRLITDNQAEPPKIATIRAKGVEVVLV